MRQSSYNVRRNNWPPLPEQCCFQPCFYQDIQVDIPLEFQKIVRHLYYLWICKFSKKKKKCYAFITLFFSPWNHNVAKRSRRHHIDRFHDNWTWDFIYVVVHTIFLLVLVPTSVQSIPFRFVVQFHGVFLHFLLSVCRYDYSSYRNSRFRNYVRSRHISQHLKLFKL
jgi:hypothetical protein